MVIEIFSSFKPLPTLITVQTVVVETRARGTLLTTCLVAFLFARVLHEVSRFREALAAM